MFYVVGYMNHQTLHTPIEICDKIRNVIIREKAQRECTVLYRRIVKCS